MKRIKFKETPLLHGLSLELRESLKGLVVPGNRARAKEIFLECQPEGKHHLETGHVFLGEDLMKALRKKIAGEKVEKLEKRRRAAKHLEILGLKIYYVHKMYCTVVKR